MNRSYDFYKDLPYCSSEQLQVEFDHASKIHSILSNSGFRSSKPLQVCDQGLLFEFLELHQRLDQIFHENQRRSEEIIRQAAKALLAIHSATGSLLHGDFVPHNIFVDQGDNVIIVDCHTPLVVGYDPNYYYGVGAIEYYFFLFNITSSFGLRKVIGNVSNVISLYSAFGTAYKRKPFGRCLFFAAVRFYQIRRLSGFSHLNVLIHLSSGLSLLFFSYVKRTASI